MLGSKAVQFDNFSSQSSYECEENESRDVGSMDFNVKCHSTKACASVEHPVFTPEINPERQLAYRNNKFSIS